MAKHGIPSGRGYNFNSQKGRAMAKRLAEMKRNPDLAKRLFGNPVKRGDDHGDA